MKARNVIPTYELCFQLRDLGQLCGLMPGNEPTSEQLHIVVGLSAGMGDSQGNAKELTPTDKLKEALSSKEAFKKHYLVIYGACTSVMSSHFSSWHFTY
jgi:hypothetical protein